jgi:hypothetical protein
MRAAALALVGGLALITCGLNHGSAAEPEVPAKQAMVIRVQHAVRDNDKAWLAAHTRYPLNYFGRHKLVIRDLAAFLRNYSLLFGAALRSAVMAQEPESVFENWQGVMIGAGLYNIWIRNNGDAARPYQIVAINGR